MVFNKIDAYEPVVIEEDDLVTEKTSKHFTLKEWEQTWMARMNGKALFISATKKENLEHFRKQSYAAIRDIHVTRFPYNNFLYSEGLE
jgi:GTP-binding protein HflX